jgi:pimeloyl-[acyl-carrier protein] methyl ester esterase
MLYSNTQGIGADLVLLHGWGFNSALFSHLVDDYKNQYRITLIDLPGHGNCLSGLRRSDFNKIAKP